MTHQAMPIFTRTFDFLTWLLPVTNGFSDVHRFTLTRRLLNAAFDFYEHLGFRQDFLSADGATSPAEGISGSLVGYLEVRCNSTLAGIAAI
jgi:hypothetical protein